MFWADHFVELSFVFLRLVIDRETGKPKGYGFCEYKDEETALSARRNLQGYVINGRQLRVDFAENDKGSDRNREQVYYPYFICLPFFCFLKSYYSDHKVNVLYGKNLDQTI